jgi:hypothetical protein
MAYETGVGGGGQGRNPEYAFCIICSKSLNIAG